MFSLLCAFDLAILSKMKYKKSIEESPKSSTSNTATYVTIASSMGTLYW